MVLPFQSNKLNIREKYIEVSSFQFPHTILSRSPHPWTWFQLEEDFGGWEHLSWDSQLGVEPHMVLMMGMLWMVVEDTLLQQHSFIYMLLSSSLPSLSPPFSFNLKLGKNKKGRKKYLEPVVSDSCFSMEEDTTRSANMKN